jgi:2-polyprenyl-6-methoxyphenol hydroxylase-like FAD-dependent oxidoreductase
MAGYDVIVVGYGPTGMVLAALLAQSGRRVAVVERYPGLYNLPRAACFDHEIMRTFQKLGRSDEVAEGTVVQRDYEWCNAEGRVLVEISYADRGTSGWPELYMMYQPHLERVLDETVRDLDLIDLHQGTRAVAIEQDEHGVRLEAIAADGQRVELRASYAVGADGGESFVRGALEIEWSDYGFQENWLVCDFAKKRELDVPEFRQVCDPAQPTAIVRIGPHHHRFSFMLEPDARREQVVDPEAVWRRVERYIDRADADLIRVANYRFRSRIADPWRDGRIFLAGDAAHEMPPFLAQGMCSGIRDAHNLAWKLDLVLDGLASPVVLDTYQREREPHVRAITEKAIELGRVQTLRDPEAARRRDVELLRRRAADQAPEKIRFPPLRDGVVAIGTPGAGELFVQGRVRAGGLTALFDDVVGHGFVLLTASRDALQAAGASRLERLALLGGRAVVLSGDGDGGGEGATHVADADGVLSAWLAERGAETVLARPDFYVFGTAAGSDGPAALLDRLERRLAG